VHHVPASLVLIVIVIVAPRSLRVLRERVSHDLSHIHHACHTPHHPPGSVHLLASSCIMSVRTRALPVADNGEDVGTSGQTGRQVAGRRT
jgi:hypothetical protein